MATKETDNIRQTYLFTWPLSLHFNRKKKWHIHRLLMSYWEGGCIDRNTHVHHINGNRLDAKKSNLTLIDGRLHLSLHNKGKTISDKTKAAIIRFNHSRKGKRHKPKRKDVTPKIVFEYRSKGYSFNKISKLTGLDWGCVKQRYNDFLITKTLLKRNNNDERTIQHPRSRTGKARLQEVHAVILPW